MRWVDDDTRHVPRAEIVGVAGGAGVAGVAGVAGAGGVAGGAGGAGVAGGKKLNNRPDHLKQQMCTTPNC